jgi:citronellol/citronellal dehydrogenase
MRQSRTPEIMADAAHAILTQDSRRFSGRFCIDDLVLWEAGVRDFSKYAAVAGTKDEDLRLDFFVPDDLPPPGRQRNP